MASRDSYLEVDNQDGKGKAPASAGTLPEHGTEGVSSMQYTLYRVNDDGTTTEVSVHEDLLTGIAAGNYTVEVEDFDYAYTLQADGVRVATFCEGRIGYREWAHRTGRLPNEYIHSLDDRYEKDVDEVMSR